MKETKFRAWDKVKKQMREVRDLHWDGQGGIDVEYSCAQINDGMGGPDTLMQFTGLKDKNGKEIYEGDILTFAQMDDLAVIRNFVEDTYWLKRRHDGEWDKKTKKDLGEIIGNIYENPELLV